MGEFGPKFSWKCPRLGCKKEIVAWTQGGLDALRYPHEQDHKREDKECLTKYLEEIKDRTPDDYSILRVTGSDVMFLLTRRIKIDHEMEYDNGPTRTRRTSE